MNEYSVNTTTMFSLLFLGDNDEKLFYLLKNVLTPVTLSASFKHGFEIVDIFRFTY